MMKNFLKNLFYCDKHVIKYLVLSLSIIILSYLLYLFLDEETVIKLGREDGLFEYFTALLFLITSILFLIIFFNRKKIIHLLMALVFFIGMGEEVSWGQRIFNYQSPEYFKENNIQNEFNFHNLKIFDSQEEGGFYKKGLSYYLSTNFLYKLFWLVYGVVLPIMYLLSSLVKHIIDRIDLLVPPFILGIIFLFNWLLFKMISSFLLSVDSSPSYYYAGIEISEFCSALVFMIIGAYYHQTIKGFTGKGPSVTYPTSARGGLYKP